tara:strand:+ start:522 stop:626 length:105 start_codon:yes stop_codon:yes gene_type:complete
MTGWLWLKVADLESTVQEQAEANPFNQDFSPREE